MEENNLSEASPYDTRAAITLRNQHESPLLRLPGEIRNKIYIYIFRVGSVRVCCERLSPTATNAYPKHAVIHYMRRHLAIIEACRQTYAEAHRLPFTLNEIVGSAESINAAFTDRFSKAQAGALTAIDISISWETQYERYPRSRADWKMQYGRYPQSEDTGLFNTGRVARTTLWAVEGCSGLKLLTVRCLGNEVGEERNTWEWEVEEKVATQMKQSAHATNDDVKVVASWESEKEPTPVCYQCKYGNKIADIKAAMRKAREEARAGDT
ncbi:Nn.00g057640.m01.CDS01 [Neocucurbitaria sp. VM-36]